MIKLTSDYLELIKQFKRTGEKYTVTHTNNSAKLESRFGKIYFSDLKIKTEELNFIKKFRKHFISNAPQISEKQLLEHRTKFFRARKQPEGTQINNVTELDINGAYFNAAKKLNYLSNELFNEGMKLSKQARLVAVGTLARNRKTFYFNGKKYFEVPEKETPEEKLFLKKYWQTIVNYTDLALHDVYFLADCYFYWVDAVFLKEEKKEFAKEIFKKHSFEVKEKPTDYLKFSTEKILVKATGEDERPFYLPIFSERLKKYFINDFFTFD